MDRRGFLKNLGLGAAMVATAPLLSQTGIEAVEPAPECPFDPSMLSVDDKYARNLLMYDEDCEPGEFTKKLVKLMKEHMKEQGERPATHDLRDLYISPEAMEDIRNWGVDEIDEQTRKEILSGSSEINQLYGTTVSVSTDLERNEIYELGRRGPYFRYANFPVEIETTIELPEDLKVSSISYEFPADGPFTEEITMVGESKVWETPPKEENLVSNAIDWQLKYCKDARWDLMQRASDCLKNRDSFVSFVKEEANA